jgi:hypothetical protein
MQLGHIQPHGVERLDYLIGSSVHENTDFENGPSQLRTDLLCRLMRDASRTAGVEIQTDGVSPGIRAASSVLDGRNAAYLDAKQEDSPWRV